MIEGVDLLVCVGETLHVDDAEGVKVAVMEGVFVGDKERVVLVVEVIVAVNVFVAD